MPAKYISPWPKADTQRRAANNRPLHQIKTTPAQSQPVGHKVFGYEVDYTTFKKYNHHDYKLGDGVLRDLAGVELWATSADLAEYFPETAAAARQIMKQITAEITGKDITTMKTPRTARDFIDELSGIYCGSRAIYNRLQKKVDDARAAMDAAYEAIKGTRGPEQQIAEAKYSIARDELALVEDAFRKGVYELESSHDAKVDELRKQFAAHLDEHYSASPDKLDASTMQLLNSGICTPSELARLAERHKDNPTMLRIVAGYADKITDRQNQSYEDYMTCRTVVMKAAQAKDGSREMAIFDSAADTAKYGIQKDSVTAGRMHKRITEWFDNYRDQMDNVPNAPAEIAPDADGAPGGGVSE